MISGVILARNEQTNIVDCVRALRPHVNEIVLIDMESEDETVPLAQPMVDKILNHELIANFDSARNIAISEVKNEWLWFVDADERISEQTGLLVHELIQSHGDQFEGINIPFKTYFCGKWMEHSGWWPGYTMPRVLKRGYFRFSETLHGGVELSGREIKVEADPRIGIDHFSYNSIEHYIEKLNRYTSTEAKQLNSANQSIDWRNAVAHMVQDLWMYYERNNGVLDGRHGWLLAWLSGQYRWLSHAKLLDIDSNSTEKNAQLQPQSLDDFMFVMNQELERLRAGEPHLPLGVVWRSPIWDYSGYADEGRCIAKSLSQTDRLITLESIPWSNAICDVQTDDAALFKTMERAKRAFSNITITNCIPTLALPDRCASLNILRTTFEADRIPEHWLPHLQPFDEVWVISNHNRDAFIRSGVAPEKIRVVPSFLDTNRYCPNGPKIGLDSKFNDRFVFLSVLDWQLRKGWDLLLRAYCEAFTVDDDCGLILKISRSHGIAMSDVISQAEEVIYGLGESLQKRFDIEIIDDPYTSEQMCQLYRAVDAFVLPSRGEGWGRPYMEAMATGLPVIGTAASGNIDFMNQNNSVLISAQSVPVPGKAVYEINVYAGCNWFEPDLLELGQAMLVIKNDPEHRKRISANAMNDIVEKHSISAGKRYFERAIAKAEIPFANHVEKSNPSAINVVWEGEFFANHSFSNINEQIAEFFIEDPKFKFSINRQFYNPTFEADKLSQYRRLNPSIRPEHRPDVTIRHAFPPNWSRPDSGRWIHIQPWEFGYLPEDWLSPICNDVDELWVPSNYVKQVYLDSGVPDDKIYVIPWGVDPETFNQHVPARILPTNRKFRFLYVGGTIERKGFDRLLDAYLKEFTPDDDVCLVIKDLGSKSFYRFGNLREQVELAMADSDSPEILFFDEDMTPGQLACLYSACDCLAMPYRGEGFGLPILESMACGTPAIVPAGGASDDFVTEETGLLLSSEVVETTHDWKLAGPPQELAIDVDELRIAMRSAYEEPDRTRELGKNAGQFVAANFTWAQTYESMKTRLLAISTRALEKREPPTDFPRVASSNVRITACIETLNDETKIADAIARIKPLVKDVLVFDRGSTDRTLPVVNEYQVQVVEVESADGNDFGAHVNTDWYFKVTPNHIPRIADSSEIEAFLARQPDIASEVVMDLSGSKLSGGESFVRFFRKIPS